jgi:hypothetical protein
MNISAVRTPTRKSQASTRSVAPPKTPPCTAAMVTARQFSSASTMSPKLLPSVWLLAAISDIS